MKKYLILFFCFSCSLLAKEQSFEEILRQVSKSSYEEEKYQLEQESLSIRREHSKGRDFQEGLIANLEYTEHHRHKERNDYIKKGTLQWGPFFVSAYDPGEKEGEYVGVGIEKNLKDLFYSQYDSQLRQLKWDEKAKFWNYQNHRQKKMIAFIQLYRDYKNALYELEIKGQERKRLEKEEAKLALSYRLGNAKRVDWQAANFGLQNLALEISALEKQKKAYEERFRREFRISLEGKSIQGIPLLEVEFQDVLEEYGRAELEEEKAKLKVQEEALQYSIYEEKIPDVSILYEHSSKNHKRLEEDMLSLNFRKKLFADHYNSKILQNEIKEQELFLAQREEEIKAERELMIANYENYQSQYQVAQNRAQLESSKYEIKKLEYDLGKIDYIDVMEAFDKYLDAKISLEKSKNRLAAYLYEWKVRKVEK